MTKKILLLATLAAFVLVCCRPGKEQEVNPGFAELKGFGAYTLQTPFYFGDFAAPPASNPLTYEGIRLGRRLFYEKLLSKNNAMSCGSCHQQALAFTDGKAVSTGVDGLTTTTGSMALSNLVWSTKFHWNGKFSVLEDQSTAPIQNPVEMNQDMTTTVQKLQNTSVYPPLFEKAFGTRTIAAEHVARALSQFVRTLISSNSRYDRFLRGELQLTESEKRGFNLFATHPVPETGVRGGNCGDCHQGPLFSGNPQGLRGFHNNGLDDDSKLGRGLEEITGKSYDRGKFRAPGLRNIALTAPYMHDGRFKTLEEVLDHYNDHVVYSSTLDPLILQATNLETPNTGGQVKLGLTEQEKKDIIAFLKCLTDSSFISNPLFAAPK